MLAMLTKRLRSAESASLPPVRDVRTYGLVWPKHLMGWYKDGGKAQFGHRSCFLTDVQHSEGDPELSAGLDETLEPFSAMLSTSTFRPDELHPTVRVVSAAEDNTDAALKDVGQGRSQAGEQDLRGMSRMTTTTGGMSELHFDSALFSARSSSALPLEDGAMRYKCGTELVKLARGQQREEGVPTTSSSQVRAGPGPAFQLLHTTKESPWTLSWGAMAQRDCHEVPPVNGSKRKPCLPTSLQPLGSGTQSSSAFAKRTAHQVSPCAGLLRFVNI
eukprot:6485857-Amphidinium_carterae.1